MRTEKCEEMMNRFLGGDHSEPVQRHLSECASCRELAALSRLAAEPSRRVEVPEHLDRSILAYAAAKRPAPVRKQPLNFVLLMRHALIPAAAAVMICFGLSFAFRSPGPAAKTVSVSDASAKNPNLPYDFDSVDSELLLISSRIQDASAQLGRTVAYASVNDSMGVDVR